MRRIVSPKRAKDYVARYRSTESSLMHWLDTVQHADWKSPSDLTSTFNNVDPVTVKSGRTVYVFDVERNRHRLIAAIHFNTQVVYILRIMTHSEYDRNRWKDEL